MIAEDLWPDILGRLPVKSICQLRCVCKSWNSLLSSSFFTTHHLTFTTATNNTRRRTFFHIRYNYRIVGGEPTFALRQDNTFTPLDSPFPPSQPFLLACLGVVHGVSLIEVDYNAPNSKTIIVLWNPSIRKYVATPWPLAKHPSNSPSFYGFGYDSRNDDFKIVINETDYYEVFSARDGLWRRNPLPDCLKSVLKWHNSTNCFVGGSIYWLTTPKDKDSERFKRRDLLVFDCGSDEFRTMDLPDQLQAQEFTFNPRLFVWGGLLRFVKPVAPWYEKFELWTMQRDGDKSRWSKLGEMDVDHEDIILGRLRLTPLLNGQALFKRFYYDNRDADAYAYGFEESTVLMDIGKPCDEDQLKMVLMQGNLPTKTTQEGIYNAGEHSVDRSSSKAGAFVYVATLVILVGLTALVLYLV